MARRKTGAASNAAPLPASEWELLPDEAKACRDVGHAWPAKLRLEFFHVERAKGRSGQGRGRVKSLERRLPCEHGCGAVKVTPYVMVRGRPAPDVTRRATVRYTKPYLLKREYADQELPTRLHFAAARLDAVPGLSELLAA